MIPKVSTNVGSSPKPDEADPKRPTPSHLYKYRSLNDDTSRGRLRSILVDGRRYFPSRLGFNDPFDCLCPSFFNVNRRDLLLFIRQRLKGMGMRGGDAKASAKKIDLLRLRDDLQGDIDKTGILSLTEKPGNLLMWAHYASSHTGVWLDLRSRSMSRSSGGHSRSSIRIYGGGSIPREWKKRTSTRRF